MSDSSFLALACLWILCALCLLLVLSFYAAVFWLIWFHPSWFLLSLLAVSMASRAYLSWRERAEERLRVVRDVMES